MCTNAAHYCQRRALGREEGDKACDQFVKSVQVLFILGEEFLELKEQLELIFTFWREMVW